jgi:DNA-binding IclR family transcriptional regulator
VTVTTRESQRTVATIDRAIDILVLFATSPQDDLGVTEIGKAVGLSKAVVHRTLTTLLSSGFVNVDPTTRRYRLGPMVLALSSAYLSRLDVRRISLPFLREISAATNETATLSVRHEWTRTYIEQVTPAREVMMTVKLGVPFPLHAGSSSKAFLAFLPEVEQAQFLQSAKLVALTPRTITDTRQLKKDLAEIRKRGYATSEGERQPGSGSIAAPVFGQNGEVVAVISVCGPGDRITEEREACTEVLLDATARASREFGYGLGETVPAT